MRDYLLEMKHISKSFGGVAALSDVSINLKKGEILAVVGENGAGKSTLMKILSGSYSYDTYSGEIIINGESKKFSTPRDAENAGVEMIYQEISVHLDLSVAENIFLGNIPKNRLGLVDWTRLFADAGKYLQMVGLNVTSREKLRNLNTSQQQLVCIARALSKNPHLLILDEPTSPLTENETRILFRNINLMKKLGISFIYISHKMKEVWEIADRVTVLRDGCHIFTKEKADTSTGEIIEGMVGRKIDTMFPKQKVQIGGEVLRVENLTVPHPYASNKNIVENLSFSLRKGEILGLGGLVGSGRSEVVNAVFGYIGRTSGDIYVEGKKKTVKNPKQAIMNGIGLLTEDRKKNGYVWTLSVCKNITLLRLKDIFGRIVLNKKMEDELGDYFVNKLSIKVKTSKDGITSLSGGNQQKVVLSKWLARDLKVILLDEPTRGIDVGAKVQIYNIMTELARQGIGIIMISSELPELLAMCDRFIVLAEGKIRAEFAQEEASEEFFMKAATGIIGNEGVNAG